MTIKIIGREKKDCDIVINDPHVSRIHLQIIKHNEQILSILDLESSTGTFVNGKKITGELFIEQNDIIKIGNTVLKWKEFFKEN